MTVSEFQAYISRFRHWLEVEGARCLGAHEAPTLQAWHQELNAAEALLQRRPELPIAFLGPSQQGKSSLINALLGENVLAVGGAVGACTCVITSLHHHAAASFRAEIDFINLDDWRAELHALRDAFASKPSDEDTVQDREEWETEQRSAREKFASVYRQEPPPEIATVLHDRNLLLPDEIAAAMRTGEPIRFQEATAQSLRNKVRRYMVGREQHADAQFWPLIRQVRIYGNFPVLRNGVVLVDLPGLNDPNPARELVTKRYLEQSRFVWLICNSQTGIDRVFTQLLREDALLFRLYIEGRLDAFSVVTTQIDNINLEAVLGQMGIDVEGYDGNHARPLAFRREEIAKRIRNHLADIARDIAVNAEAASVMDDFHRRVAAIPVFSVSTMAYLHATGRQPLYAGMQLTAEDTHVPRLLGFLDRITHEQSFQQQISAAGVRLRLLREQIERFFFARIRTEESNSAAAKAEWANLVVVATAAITEGRQALAMLRVETEATLHERSAAFGERLAELETRAGRSLESTFTDWETINWRTLQATVKRRGEWQSTSLGRNFDFNRDIANSYLRLVPFIWDEFFGTHLAGLTTDVSKRAQAELHKTSEQIRGAMAMIKHQPAGIRDSIQTSVRTATEAFHLQSGHVRAELNAQIQRTRQALSSGMVATAAAFMQPAYARAAADPGGSGIKRRMLDILTGYARQHAPDLFINMRQELSEGVATLSGSMKPQLARLVAYGDGVLDRFRENMESRPEISPETRDRIRAALAQLPPPILN